MHERGVDSGSCGSQPLAETAALLVAVPSIAHPVKQYVKHKSVTEQTNRDHSNHLAHRAIQDLVGATSQPVRRSRRKEIVAPTVIDAPDGLQITFFFQYLKSIP